MADEVVKQDSKQPTAAADVQAAPRVKKKKSRPTNCVQSNKRIRRKDWYYRDGKYFANKKSFKLFADKAAQELAKKKAEGLAKAAAPKEEAPKE